MRAEKKKVALAKRWGVAARGGMCVIGLAWGLVLAGASAGARGEAEYIAIDVSGGAAATSYPVELLDGVPSRGWSDEHKTTKIVLRRCPKGVDPLGRYRLTKDFYAGVFEVTQKQWELVMGTNPSRFKGDMRPVECVSFTMIRGMDEGMKWPESASVDAESFVGKLRARTGLVTLDLPTEAQWEYACRAGTTTEYNTGDGEDALMEAGRYFGNCSDGKGGYSEHTTVGLYAPNAWGLYDMHGNVWECCLDRRGKDMSGNDPPGAASGSVRRICGGGWGIGRAEACTSTSPRRNNYISLGPGNHFLGFRLFRTVP